MPETAKCPACAFSESGCRRLSQRNPVGCCDACTCHERSGRVCSRCGGRVHLDAQDCGPAVGGVLPSQGNTHDAVITFSGDPAEVLARHESVIRPFANQPPEAQR